MEYILQNVGNLSMNYEEIHVDREKNQYYCETLFTAISTGTEIAAFYGEKPLRKDGGYPRKLGYLNLAQIIAAPIGAVNYQNGDLILTNQSHCDRFVCAEEEILSIVPDLREYKSYLFSYVYHMAFSTIFGYGVAPQSGIRNVGIIGNGLISQAVSEICLMQGIPQILISEFNSKIFTVKKPANYKRFSRGDLETEVDSTCSIVVVSTNDWSDYKLALKLVSYSGSIVLLGFPGRNGELPSFNPFEPTLFYVKNVRVISLPRTRLDLHGEAEKWLDARSSVSKIVSDISAGDLGKIARDIPTIPYSDLGAAYENLKSMPDRPLSFILKW